MKNLTAQAVYNADIYLRLSDDDGDKPESNSIKNQREFITEFLKSMPEIRIHAERKDDGFSGVDFFRPGIQEVLQDVRSGDLFQRLVLHSPLFSKEVINLGSGDVGRG